MFMTIFGLIVFVIVSLLVIYIIGYICSTSTQPSRRVSADDFNKIAVALGAIATIAWGFFTYGALEQRDKAKAELVDLENRIKDTESTSFVVDAPVIKGDDFFYITPSVTVKNNSKTAIYIKLDPDSLSVTRVVAKGDKPIPFETMNPVFYQNITKDGKAPISNITVPIGAERKLNYIVQTNYPGMYYITFTASAMDSSGNLINKTYDGKPVKWFSSSYIYVK
ncbi:hypothetical protein G5647_18700 [Pectobacterium carotovorum]|nr:hypothetical protein [Pectobacterium carotovorum]RJL46668.1 hypothetical protein D5078_11100 [Pectobacterium carotovorum]